MAKKEATTKETKNIENTSSSFLSKIKKETIIIGFLIVLIITGSIIAFQIISKKNKIIEIAETKKQLIEDEQARLASLKRAMEQLIKEETNFLQVTSNTTADESLKEDAAILYKTGSVSLINAIGKKITLDDYDKFDANLLLNYARHLDITGDPDKARPLFEYITKHTKDSIILAYSYCSLANLYAINSSSSFNPERSREYRIKDIAIAKTLRQGDLRYLKLIDLYEAWALDEYTRLKNKENANKIIDTVFYCINRLPDYSTLKAAINKRVHTTYNFYNDIIIPENSTGDYKFYINNQGVGDAYITFSEDQNFIRVDYMTEGKLIGQLTGIGSFIDFNLLKFDVKIERYSDVHKTKKSTSGKKGKLLDGTLTEYGGKPVAVKLAKQE